MTHKPPQGIDAPNCAHKQLKKQMVGEQLWYVCECGQKFRIEPWDGKVSVLAPPDPRKDLEALEELVAQWRKQAEGSLLESSRIRRTVGYLTEAGTNCVVRAELWKRNAAELEQRLAEMRGAKR